MSNSTPFNNWALDGQPDPHGNLYGEDYKVPLSIYELSESLTSFPNIMILTVAKETLRFLSRKLYRLTHDHSNYNKARSEMLCGDLTDDELANAFYLYETPEYLQAGSDRIKWLADSISIIEDNIKSDNLVKLVASLNVPLFTTAVTELTYLDLKPDVPKHYKQTGRGKFKKSSRNNRK